MNEQQYRCLCENRRRRGTLAIGQERTWRQRPGTTAKTRRSPIASVVARAARDLRQRQRAASAWQKVVPPTLLSHTHVAATETSTADGRTLVIAAHDATTAYELRRQSNTLQRKLLKLIPGIRRMKIVVEPEEGCLT